jgi:2-methylcitrate dehydratase PrpD
VSLPASLAAAEIVGAHGVQLVEGVALGDELMIRLGLMMSPKGEGPASNWFLTQFFGYLSGALSAGLVMALTEDQLVSALGLAYMQAAGGKEAGFGVGSDARALYPAFAALGGLNAALLARAGVVGPPGALDGAASLFRVYFGAQPDDAAIARLLEPDRWEFRDTDTKPWPCCRLSHPYVAVALEVRARIAGRPIQRVRIGVNASAAKLCRPLVQRRRPQTLQDAKFSIPFMTAFALVHGKVTLDTLDMRALGDAQVLEVASRVEIEERLPDAPGHPPAELEVEVSGETIVSPPFGDIRMSDARIRDKFLDCLAHVGHARDAPALWDRLMALDETSVAEALRAIPVDIDESESTRSGA